MKIQNAEMEFVAFDAQDVIATSGGPGTILGYFAGTTSASDGYTFNDSKSTFNLGNDEERNRYEINMRDLSKLNSSYYIINSASYTGDNPVKYYLSVDTAETAPGGSGYKFLEDYSEIRSWLQKIATPKQ